MSTKVKGYKAMNADMTCRGFKFEVGKTYEHSGEVALCSEGFHFCENLLDVYNYYEKSENTVVVEVEAVNPVKEGDKSVTKSIKIIRVLDYKEILGAWFKKQNSGDCNSGYYNSGNYNSGNYNSGYCNSGDCNSGYYNSGDCNSGYYNSGNRNSGYYNSGNYNSGNYNSGYCNSGDYNSGNYNSGYYNSGNRNSGYFNSDTPKVRLFGKNTDLEFNDPRITRLLSLNVKPILSWIETSKMTEDEKIKFPSHKTTGGFLRNTGRMNWTLLTDDDKKAITSLPGYDDEIFKTITGISLIETDIEVTVNGVVKKIKKEDAKKLGLI